MKRRFRQLLSLSLILFVSGSVFAQETDMSGNWSGKINIPGGELEMIFKISRTDGTYEAKLDVPKQGATNLPVGDVIVTSDSLKIAVPAILGNYAGKIISTDSISGKWSQSGMSFDVNLSRTDQITEMKRPQHPVPPFPYLSEEVEYTNSKSRLKIAGTLTLPKDKKDCPAVVMITGSGAEDRDETVFGHKPFAVIADYLTRNGIAVLRCDDRGVGGSEGDVSSSTSEDFASDALAGLEYLQERKEIDSEKIGLIGHSEGGLIAPIAAVESDDVAFIVLMAGTGVTGEQIILEQSALISKAAGLPEYAIEQGRLTNQKIFDIVKSEPDSAKTVEKLRQILAQGMYDGMNDDMKKMIDAKIQGVNSPWFRYFLTYDPKPTLTRVKCPVLAINGTKDLQVPVSNLKDIIEAVNSGGNMQIDTMSFIHHNHLFQICETGAISEYSQIEETIDPEVLKTMKDWILKVSTK